MGLDRNYIKQLCELYFPKLGEFFSLGTVGMDHICKDYEGKGTTCGFLTHWLLWKAGCGDTKLVNRTEPDSSFKFVVAANISRISGSSAFVHYNPANPVHVEGFRSGFRRPQIGDFIIIQGKPLNFDGKEADSSHIFVILDNGDFNGDQLTYTVCQTGQTTATGVQSGHRTSRKFQFSNNKWLASGEVFKQGPIDRHIIGWLNLSACNFSKYWDTHEILFNHTSRTSQSLPSPNSVVGIWYVASPEYPPGWYYMFHKGYRVFYAYGGQPSRIAGSGYWFTENNTINTMWETASGVSERITMISPTSGIGAVVSSEDPGSGFLRFPFTMQKRRETAPAVINSFRDGSGLPMGPPIG
jgi:hypothetical protein